MGGCGAKGGGAYKVSPEGGAICCVKQVSDHSSFRWRIIEAAPCPDGPRSARGRRPHSFRVPLASCGRVDLILSDADGDGLYDTVVHGGLPLEGVKGAGRLPPLAFDTEGDGRADTLVFDAAGQGRYDRVVSRLKAPLSFLATMSRAEAGGPDADQDLLVPGPGEGDAGIRPLAPGWERRLSQSQGVFYFYHRDSRQTSWEVLEAELPPWPVCPSLSSSALVEDSPRGALASSRSSGGSKEPFTPSHGPPSTPSHGQSERPLAPGWERRSSRSLDRDYYVHAASGRTTWNVAEAQMPEEIRLNPGYPKYWQRAGQATEFTELVHSGPVFRQVQMLLASTFLLIRTRDRKDGTRLPDGLEAVKVWRVENAAVWRRYSMHRKRLQGLAAAASRLPGCDPPPRTSELLTRDLSEDLDASVNEDPSREIEMPAGGPAFSRSCAFRPGPW